MSEIKSMALSAAKEIIIKNGINALSVRKVTSCIGYSASTLYSVFYNIDELIMHINIDTLSELIDFIRKNSDNSINFSDNLKKIINSYIIYKQQNHNMWEALFEYQVKQSKECQWYNEKLKTLFHTLKDCITSNVNNISDIEFAILWGSIHGIILLHSKGKFAKIGIDTSLNELCNNLIAKFQAVTG